MKVRTVLIGFATVALGATLLWLLVRSTGVRAEDLKRACLHLRPIPLLAILAAVAASIAAGAEKWRLVQNRFSPKPVGRGRAVALSAMGSAAGQFLPAPLASALARGGGTHVLEGAGGRRGALSSVWEQLFDIVVIGLFTAPALLALRFVDVRWFLVGVPVLAVAGDGLAGPATLLARRLFPPARALLEPTLSRALYRLSLVKFCALVAMTLGVAWAIRSNIAPLALATAIPPVATAATLSFVPAGLGVNEWTFVLVLGLLGAPSHAVAAFAIMNRVIVGSVSILFGLLAAAATTRRKSLGGSSLARGDSDGDRLSGDSLEGPLNRVQRGAD